jgi:hypothetical protein
MKAICAEFTTLLVLPFVFAGWREWSRTILADARHRGTGCARESACGGTLRTQCVLRLSYLRAIAARWFETRSDMRKGSNRVGAPFCACWLARVVSNHRPLPCQGSALPLSYAPM